MKQFRPLEFLLRILQGALIGCGAILPGVSGGVLCAAFGVYEPIMDFLGNPIKGFKKHIMMLIPIVIGGGLGFVGLAYLVNLLLDNYAMVALALFAGLICGTVPSLAGNAVKEEPKRGWMAFILSMFPTFILFILISETSTAINPNFGWFVFAGAIWGLSMVVPGLSSSSVLLFLGLYEPMNAGIYGFDFLGVLLPLAIGFVATILACAKPINYLIKHQYPIFSKLILGFVISSVSVIAVTEFFMNPEEFPRAMGWDILVAVLCFAAGFALAMWMGYMEDKKDAAEAAAACVEETQDTPAEDAVETTDAE